MSTSSLLAMDLYDKNQQSHDPWNYTSIPVFAHPPSVTANQAPTITTNTATSPSLDLLSVSACPSLSSSPSPLSLHSSDFSFCNPRDLTVSPVTEFGGELSSAPTTTTSTASSGPLTFPILPTLCPGDDEEHKHILGGGEFFSTPQTPSDLSNVVFDFVTQPNCYPSAFDCFSDLDSNDDIGLFANWSPTENVANVQNNCKRPRSNVTPFEDNFLSDEEFQDFDLSSHNFSTAVAAAAALPSPPQSISSRRGSEDVSPAMKSKKRARTVKPRRPQQEGAPDASHDYVNDSIITATRGSSQNQQEPSYEDGDSAGQSQSGSDHAVTSGSDDTSPNTPLPVNRRGRKQSLTEDPSKTFVCELCGRRFRRQEHLKRHYRSLHTQDKPFKCEDCGKTFSRSDNLSQHARTHGSGAIVMGVYEEGELPQQAASSLNPKEMEALSDILFESSQLSTSSSDFDSSEELGSHPTDNKQRRKRKRDE